MDEAIDRALATQGGPVVIADVSDNAGGGAPGDATFFLRRLLERGIRNAASGYYWDPIAVRACMDAGKGARFDLRIGGKSGVASGDPIDLTITVMGMADSVTQRFGEAPVNMGATAWVSAEGIDLILTSLRTQVFHPEGMTKLGLDLDVAQDGARQVDAAFLRGLRPDREFHPLRRAARCLAPRFRGDPLYQTHATVLAENCEPLRGAGC